MRLAHITERLLMFCAGVLRLCVTTVAGLGFGGDDFSLPESGESMGGVDSQTTRPAEPE